jgi:hypothetical protein
MVELVFIVTSYVLEIGNLLSVSYQKQTKQVGLGGNTCIPEVPSFNLGQDTDS